MRLCRPNGDHALLLVGRQEALARVVVSRPPDAFLTTSSSAKIIAPITLGSKVQASVTVLKGPPRASHWLTRQAAFIARALTCRRAGMSLAGLAGTQTVFVQARAIDGGERASLVPTPAVITISTPTTRT